TGELLPVGSGPLALNLSADSDPRRQLAQCEPGGEPSLGGHTAPTGPSLKVPDLDLRERVVAGVLVVLIVALGFFPKPVLDIIRPATNATMQLVQMTDPAPSVPSSQVNSK
ncbi:MAG: hypothetical protein M3Y49_06790, partial [Actinomycetota bacterium]|nr:hypothetical protein [Actinomycetota bacterium]